VIQLIGRRLRYDLIARFRCAMHVSPPCPAITFANSAADTKPKLSRRAFAGTVLALGLSFVRIRPAQAAEPVGRIDAVRGLATATSDGSLRALQVGAEIFSDEVVQTEHVARVEIAIGDQARINLGERTRFVVESSATRGSELRLEEGALLLDAPVAAIEDLTVKTQLATIAARGARLFVGPSNGVIGVFVERGIARVANKAGEVRLQAAQGTDLTSAEIAPTPAREWSEARIAAALANVA
jgi:ferric-dicitrate binding protein FerR (iron transport regulator)